MRDFPRHQCMIYEGAPSTHLEAIATTMIERLAGRYRCLYLNRPTMVAGMRSYLAAAGANVQAEVDRGALVLSSDQSHLVNGKFKCERMIAALSRAVQDALRDGYIGLWAAGDMTWEFGREDNLASLSEYERQLEAFMQTQPALCGVCLYHRARCHATRSKPRSAHTPQFTSTPPCRSLTHDIKRRAFSKSSDRLAGAS